MYHVEDDVALTPSCRCGSVPNFMCQGMSVTPVVIKDALLSSALSQAEIL